MARPSSFHECSICGSRSTKWSGRCGGCGEWNTLVEKTTPDSAASAGDALRSRLSGTRRGHEADPVGARLPPPIEDFGHAPGLPQRIGAVQSGAALPFETGLSEFDRVLSGGLVPGSVTLLGGEPGIGKSTLVLQAVITAAHQRRRALVIAAEESAEQVRHRADRLGPLPEECYILSTGNLLAAVEAADRVRPSLLVIDSIQAISDPSISSTPGSPNQVRDCAQLLAQYAKATSTAVILIGHVTKDGALAGPRTLEHLVDTVLSFEGDRHYALRALVAVKHRFGAAGELGLFEMGDEGLVDLVDAGRLLLGDRREDAAGSMAVPIVEGRRPLVVEVQALVAQAPGTTPKRVSQGIPASRLVVLLAVLERNCGYRLGAADVFVSTVGGIKVTEPAADLPLALAVCSAVTGLPLPLDTVAFGEIGLAGEVRQVAGAERRLAEAARLGFRRVVAPMATPDPPAGLTLVRVRSVAEAVDALGYGLRVDSRCEPAGDTDRARRRADTPVASDRAAPSSSRRGRSAGSGAGLASGSGKVRAGGEPPRRVLAPLDVPAAPAAAGGPAGPSLDLAGPSGGADAALSGGSPT
jgi:DNA repair protein RadA/Sms